ncbi:MAG: hypothetical protein H8K06_15295 [Nitrospira sp.]|nr:hypothetical protein [Nitrospira sp.]
MGGRSRNETIFLATPAQLVCPECYLWLWTTVLSLTHLSSAGLITAIEELYRDAEYLGIHFRYPSGQIYDIPFIFEIFPDENESGRRWVSNFRKADATGARPRYMCRCLPKLQAVELLVQCTVAKYSRGTKTQRCSYLHTPLGW